MSLIKITENWSRKINIQSIRHVRDSRMWFIETEQHTLKKHPESYFRAACEQQGRWDTTEQHTECESRTPLTDSNNKQSRDGRNVSERNLNETRKIHPKVINLSKRNLKESEVKLLKNGLKFTPTPNEDQRLSRACIVRLVIKRTNWSYVKIMSCSGSHLGVPINIKNTKFVKDLPMIDPQFRFNQCNSFREENISVFSHMVLC